MNRHPRRRGEHWEACRACISVGGAVERIGRRDDDAFNLFVFEDADIVFESTGDLGDLCFSRVGRRAIMFHGILTGELDVAGVLREGQQLRYRLGELFPLLIAQAPYR
jgi:hypothetical protein